MARSKPLHGLMAMLVALGPVAASAQATRPIGSVAAANEAMLGTPPAERPRPLLLGNGVVQDERVETSALGAGQFLFLDGTALTVWPSSDIVLDRYVFDPDRGTGEMTLSVTRGLLRFIGGSISKNTDVIVNTPHAVVAVRGGVGMIEVTDEQTSTLHVAGACTRINDLCLARSNVAGAARGKGPGETRFLGPLDRDALRALFTRKPGQGSGGLSNAPSDEEAEGLITSSGIDSQLSGRRHAATEPRLSTYGAQEHAAVTNAESRPLGMLPATAIDPARSRAVSERPPQPVTPPTRFPIVTPVDGLSGGRFGLVGGEAADNIVVQAGNFDGFTGFFHIEEEDGSERVEGETASGVRVVTRTDSGFVAEVGQINGQSALTLGFVDPGIFEALAFRSLEGPETRALHFFGTPTDAAVWQVRSGDDLTARLYDLSFDLFTGLTQPFPESDLGDPFPFGGNSGLILVPEPNAPLLPSAPAPSFSKWVTVQFHLNGLGPEQGSALGVLTSVATPTDAGAPAMLTNAAPGTVRLGATDVGATVTGQFGLLDDGAGNTVFGSGGEYFVIGQGARTSSSGARNLEPMRLTGEVLGETVDVAYGNTRVGRLTQTLALVGATRSTLGVAPPDGFTAGAPDRRVLTGGFAAVNATSTVHNAYMLATRAAPDVRLGFEPSRNSAFAEFSALGSIGADTDQGVSNLSLNFGDDQTRSALLSDRQFAMRDATGETGPLTGQQIGADLPLAPDVTGGLDQTRRSGFTGVLASSGLAGNANLPEPEFLRWGWWGGTLAYDPQLGLPNEHLHMGSWVAGVVSDIASVNAATGTASYQGGAIAHVAEELGGGRRAAYVSTGTVRLDYDFGARSGTASLGLMGSILSGTVGAAAALPGNHYGGTLSGTNGARGTVDGAFFSGGGSAIAATAGRFDATLTGVGGGAATAAGIFAASRNVATGN